MAELLNRIPTNLTEYPNSFKRQGAFPLEAYSVFYTMADAEAYATSNPVSYVGQTLAVVTANAADATIVDDVTFYIIADAAGTLQEVGKATNGDGNSITLTDGVLSLTGFDAAGAATLPQKSPVYKKDAEGNNTEEIDHYELKWVTIDAIVEGDGNTKTVVVSDDTKVTVTPEYNEGADTYTYKIKLDLSDYATTESVNASIETLTEAIGTALQEAKDYADANDTVYDDTALASRVKAIEDDYLKDADKYDDTALAARVKALEDEERYDETPLANRVEALETSVNNEETGLGAHETRIQAMEAFWEATENADEVVDTLKEIQDYIKSDKTGAATMAGNIQANTEAIEVLNGDDEGSVNKKIADAIAPLATSAALDAVRTTAEAAQTADEVADAIDAKITAENLGQYAKATEVEATYAKAADVVDNGTFDSFKTANDKAIADARTNAVADVEAKGYAVASEVATTYATKEELTAHGTAAESAYAKKTDVYTTEEVDSMIAGINQGNQESASAVNTKLTNYIASNDKEIENLKTKDTELTTAIGTAQAQADKGVADAAAAAKAVSDLTAGQVTANKNDIDAVKGRVTTLETAKGDHETRISSAEGKITSIESTANNNSTAIGNLQGSISTLTAEDARLEGLIDALTSNKANASEVYSKTDADKKIQDAIAAIPSVDLTPYAKTEDVEASISSINASLATKAEADEVYTIAVADSKFMTQDQVDARVNALIDGANSEDTIANVVNLVTYVNENAADIAELLTTVNGHTTAIQKNAGDIVALNSAIAGITTDIAAIIQPKASEEISVAANGTLGIEKVSTDKLVQGSETLVLKGGNATVVTA